MTYGGHFSKTAKGAINRFYEHADTRNLNQLQELVSELYLAEGAAKEKLWKKAGDVLERVGVPADKREAALAGKDPKKLAELVAALAKVRK